MIIFSVISGLRAVLKPEEQAHGPLHGRKGHQRVQTGAAGALVEDAEDRQGVAVLDAGGEVPFAGHGDDHAGPRLDHDAPGDGPAGGQRQMETVTVPQLQQAAHGALSATAA